VTEEQAFKFARNVARKLWDDDEAESAAGEAVIQFLKLEAKGNPYPLLKTITARRVTDAMRERYGRRSARENWPTVAVSAGGQLTEQDLDLSRERCIVDFGPRNPMMLSALVGEERELIDVIEDHQQSSELEAIEEAASAASEVQQVLSKFTSREQEAFKLLASGLTLRETGEQMGVSESRICQIRSRAIRRVAAG